MAQLFFNNGRARLAAAISASQTTLQLQGRVNLPNSLAAGDWFLLTIARQDSRYGTNVEVVKVTAVSGETVTVQRGYEGAAVPHEIFEVVECRTTADTYGRMLREALWEHVGSKPATATRWPNWAEVTGKPSTYAPSAHTHPWAEITGAPDQATRWPVWAEVGGKPTNFPPSTHSHDWNQVANAPATATRWPTWGEVTNKPGTTDSRTSTSTALLLQAKGMNDHRNSGDHDTRYHTKTEADSRYLTVASGGDVAGNVTIKKPSTSSADLALHGRQTTTAVVSRVRMDNDAETSTAGVIEAWRRAAGSLDLELSGFRQVWLKMGLVTNVGVTVQNAQYNPLDIYSRRTSGLIGGIRFHGGGTKRGELNFQVDGAILPGSGAFFSGNGQGLMNLPASAIASGVIPTTRLPTTDSRTSSSQTAILTAKGMNDHRLSGDHDSRYALKAGDDLSGDLSITKNNPWLTLNSSTTGANGVEQAAGITIGESGYKGSAALHLTYTGDGRGHIGMGTVDPLTSLPTHTAMRLYYLNSNVDFLGTISGNGSGLTSLNASNLGSGTVPVARLPSASTSAAGVVQLNNTLTSTLTTQAATANAVKLANDAAVAANTNANNRVAKSGDTLTGAHTFAGNMRWSVSTSNTAHQRVAALVDATNFARCHWYGVSDTEATSNFRHAWYDGAAYINITCSSGVVNWGGHHGANSFRGNPSDTVTAPSFTWTADTNTGMYRVSDTEIGFTINGVKRAGINASGFLGAGSQITALNASNLASGTVPIARISSTSARNSSSTSALLEAKAMNDHVASGDHDSRYVLKAGDTLSGTLTVPALQVTPGTGIAIGTATPSSAYNINMNDSFSANGTRAAIRSTANIEDGTLSANRTHYGIFNSLRNDYLSTETFTLTQIAAHNEVINGPANDAAATIDRAEGSRNYVLNRATGTVSSAFGSYNYVLNSRAGAITTNAYGSYNVVQQSAGTVTNAYAGYFRVVGTIASNSYGIYTTGEAKNYFAGAVGIGTTAPTQKLHVVGSVLATGFIGAGGSLTGLNATNISTGTINAARLPTTVFNTTGNQTAAGTKTFSGSIVIDGTSIAPDLQVVRTNATTNANMRFTTTSTTDVRIGQGDPGWFSVGAGDDITWAQTGVFRVGATSGNIQWTGTATGNGSGITSLNASNLASGTVPIARISSTSSRTSTSEATLLHAKAMNDHRTSGDHDGRYVNKSGDTISGDVILNARGVSYKETADKFNRSANHIAFSWTAPTLYAHVDAVNQFAVGTSSDYRIKKNIRPMEAGLAGLMRLKPVTFDMVGEEEGERPYREMGFLAHEVQEVFPSLVTGEKDQVDKDGNALYQGVNYALLTAVLTAAVQELTAKIGRLEKAMEV